MKRNLVIGILIFLAFLLMTYLASGQILSTLARYEIKKLESNQLKISFSNINLIGISSPTIEIKDLSIQVGRKEYSQWDFSIQSIRVLTNWKAWLDNSYSFRGIEILGAKVKLSEKKAPPQSSSSTSLADTPFFRVGFLNIKDSQFSYINLDPKNKRKPGELVFQKIDGEIYSFNRETVNSGVLEGKVSGEFGSGRIDLNIKTTLLKEPLEVFMNSEIENVKLAAINNYLAPTEGLKLKGVLRNAHAKSFLKSSGVKTQAQMLYSNLEIEVLENGTRSSVTAGLAEPILQGMICNTNHNRGGFEKVHVSHRARKPEESIVQFLLLGLLKVSLNVACLGDIVSP